MGEGRGGEGGGEGNKNTCAGGMWTPITLFVCACCH